MWRILSETSVDGAMPSPTEFYDMFYELSLPWEAEYIEFLKVCDQWGGGGIARKTKQ